MAITRSATARYDGTGKDGKGTLTTQSGVLQEEPYGFTTRFGDERGTNPEELIAAAHSGCFTMALSFQLTNGGFEPTELKTVATVSMEKQEPGWTITNIHLDVEGKVPGVAADQFQTLAENAKKGCPISRALASTNITMSAKLA